MDNLNYNILKSGSDGNCVIFNDYLSIDMGITYKQIKPYLKKIKNLGE